MNTFITILNWLSGKKSVIAGVILTTVGYLAAKGIIGDIDVVFIGTLVTIIFGGVSYATGKLIYDKKVCN